VLKRKTMTSFKQCFSARLNQIVGG